MSNMIDYAEFDLAMKKIKELEAKLAKFEWQPIETAPMDGTPILVWLVVPSLGSRVHAAVFRKNVRLISGHFAFDMPAATHWQLEPESPKE